MPDFPTPADAVYVERMNDTFTKYHLPDGRVLHHFAAAHDEHFHNHPWPFTTTIGPKGGYIEEVLTLAPDGSPVVERHERLPGHTYQVGAGTIHRLVGLPRGEAWTVITPGAPVQKPSFSRWRTAACGFGIGMNWRGAPTSPPDKFARPSRQQSHRQLGGNG